MPQVSVNYLAVLVAGVVAMAFGMAWYGIFGKTWMKLTGMSQEKVDEAKKKGMAKSYALQFVATLVMGYVLAHIISYAGATTVTGGMQAGFWSWLGFMATLSLGDVLWEGKSWKLYCFSNAHDLINLLIMGSILAVWR